MAVVGDKTENYFDEAYWNNRYTRDSGSFDWYQHYRGIAPLIKMYTKTTDEVLMVGCGSAHKKMDVRCMKEFEDEAFHCVLDKGMLDNLTCGASAQTCVASMLSEVYRLLKPGGIYFLISYGDPRSRMVYLKTKHLPWENIILHVIPRLNSRRSHEAYPLRKITEPVILQEDLTLGPLFNLEDPDLHFVYVCIKVGRYPKLQEEHKYYPLTEHRACSQ